MAPPLFTNYVAYDTTNAAYWGTQVFQTGTVIAPTAPNALHGSSVQVGFTRSEPAGVREDLAIFDLHMWVNTGAGAFSSLNASDAAAAETAISAMWTTIKTLYPAHITLATMIWRDWGADFPTGKTGLSKPGPVWRQTSFSVSGSGAPTPLPDQVAESCTFRTASRRHWGRIYLPPVISTLVDANGRLSQPQVDILSGAVRQMLVTLNSSARQLDVVVWSPKYRGALGVSQVVMDDVFDIIRRRRAKVANYHKIYSS